MSLEAKTEKLSVSGDTRYVCELHGDDQATGLTQDKPLKTATAALELGAGTIMIRRDGKEYAPISGAALKKAKKGLEVQKRKAGKEADKKAKEAELAEAEQRRLEESKKIVLPKVDQPSAKVL
jgi:asparaginyl-tRNA synthetase